ncbi:MAG: hypothetical protein WC719_02050 [Patescibacteria group bacterium]|jgi:hypothetical protein
MEIHEVQFIPRQTKSQKVKTDSDDSDVPVSSWRERIKKSQLAVDAFRFISAAIVASGVYFLAVWLMSDTMNYFLKHFIGLIIGGLFLAAFRAVQSTPPVIGKAVVIWLSLLFIYNISNHYFISSDGHSDRAGQVISKKGHPADSVVALRPGRYSFKLEPGMTTKWMKLPYGEGLINYHISSPNYNYQFIIAGKKKVYKGGKDASVPLEVGLPFQIQALGDETITIVIARV